MGSEQGFLMLSKKRVAKESNDFASRKQKGGGEVIMIITASVKTSREKSESQRRLVGAECAKGQCTVWPVDDKQDDVARDGQTARL